MQVQTMMEDQALVELEEREMRSPGGVVVVRDPSRSYASSDDWEWGHVRALGEGDWEPVGVGDRVIVKAALGGLAGSDVSRYLGDRHVIVTVDEIVARVVE